MNGDYECEMLGDTYEKDLMVHAQRLEINPQTATALSTAAWTELCAVETLRHQELSVTAAVTGGIDSNGMCPGDPSSYLEVDPNEVRGRYERGGSCRIGAVCQRRSRNEGYREEVITQCNFKGNNEKEFKYHHIGSRSALSEQLQDSLRKV